MAKIVKHHHGIRFTAKVIIDTNDISRGYSGTGEGKQTFNISLREYNENDEDKNTNYELQLSRQEVEETIKRWQAYLEQYPVKV